MNWKHEINKVAKSYDPLLLSAAEAARLLGVSESSLRRRVKEGLLRQVRIGRRVLYSKQAIVWWIEGRDAA
jgi:excisionase family DNA binding protein